MFSTCQRLPGPEAQCVWYPVGCQSSLQGTPTNVDAMAADATTLSTADNTDPFIPKYTDGTPIQWDGNYAHIDGALYVLRDGPLLQTHRPAYCYSSFSSSIALSHCPMAE